MTTRSSAAKLIAVLALALVASDRAPSLRAETALGEMVDLARLTHPLPDGFRSVEHAVSSEGLLFLSDDEQVIVWTPWGWQTLWTSRGKDGAGTVEAIACTEGDSGERLLIVTSDDVKVVTWQRKGGDASTVWGKAEYEFRLQATAPHPQLSGLAVNPAEPRPAGAALGYAFDEYGALFAIRDAEIPTIDAVPLKSAVDFAVFSSSGYAFAWAYKGKTVAILSPAGEAVGEIDVAAVLAEDDVQRRNLEVRCVWATEQRNLLCIGTSLGLAIGRLDPDSGRPELEVQRAVGLGTAGVLALGEFCGRLLIVADSDRDGGDGGVFIEAGFVEPTPDIARFAKEVQFTVVPGPAEMGRPSEAVVTGPDVVWAKGIGGLYEWTPAGWRHLEFEVELPTPQEVSASPVVLREPFRERLWCLRPKESDAFCPASVALGRIHVNVADLCPDPSGGGVWIWDRSGSGGDRGYVRFASPHAIIDNRSGTTFPADFAVARTVHRDSSGSVHTPVARNGALLLPTGKDFLLGRGGHWSETDASALAGERLLELTPGATSASAAWLAIRQAEDGSSHVVTLDLDPDSAPGSPKIIVEEVGLSCAPGANVALVPDSSGSVWFAVQENVDWRLTEILPGVGEGSSLVASGMEETPRYLFLSPVPTWFGDGFVLTDTGGCRVAHADRIGGSGGGLMLLTPEVGAWAPLWKAPALGPVVRAEYDVVISDGWGFVDGDPRVIVLRRVGEADAETFEVAPSSTTPSLKAEPAARRLSGGPLAAFRPLLWFPGINEFVVGDLQSRPFASELLAIPTGGVSAVPSATWLRELPENVSPNFGACLFGTGLNRVGAGGDVIVVAGGGVAFREAPSSTDSVIYVPTRVAVNIGDRRETYDVRHRLPPQPLPAGITGIAVEAAPDYGGWWRPDHARVVLLDQASDNPDRTFESLVAGPAVEFQVPMEPGVRRELVLSTDGWPSVVPNELDPLQIQQAPPEPRMSPWWLLASLSIASLLTLLAVAVSTDLYHLVLSQLGFRWKFAEEDAQVEVSVRSGGGSDAIFRYNGDARSRPVSVPPDRADFREDRERWKESAARDRVATVHVQADVDHELFRHDWHACFSEPWTGVDSRIFAGLIYNSGRDGQGARQDASRRGPMIVSVLAGGIGDQGLIPFMAHTAQLIEGSFKGPGFRVHAKHRDGTRTELQTYLKESDIVVVLAHAENGAWKFPGGDFGASDWREIAPSIRCRCMIILGCGLGDLLSSEDPLLLEVVRSGVTCVASTRSRQDAVLGNELVPAFCKIWRSDPTVGPTLAEALHRAAVGVATNRARTREEIEKDLNAYVVIGTPTLRLEWRRVRAGVGA